MNILALSTNYPYHQDLLKSLKESGVNTEFATSHDIENELKSCPFYIEGNTKLINGKDFYTIKKLQKIMPAEAPALDRKTLDYFINIERDFYIIADRYAYYPKSFRTQKRLFRMGIRYWLWFYQANKIDAVFSICSPHNFPDYTAFFVAQYLGIKTIMTTDVMINNHVLILDDFRQSFKTPKEFLANLSEEEVKETINQSLSSQAFAESIEITYAKVLNDNQIGAKKLNQSKFKKAKTGKLERTFFQRASKIIHKRLFAPKFKAAFAMNGEYSDFRRRFIRLYCGFRLRKVKNDYNSIAIYPDFSNKYVYFAMHLNPERTSQPEAEIFEDHLLAIEILAKSVPNDWVVYVKENPSQNGRKLNLVNGKHFRDISDYLDFTRFSNVKLIRQDVKTADLIGKAAIVSTLKGSVGWEAINAGKACVIFSNAWYSACCSAYRVNSVKSCKEAFEAVKAKPPQEVEADKLKFLSYMQDKIVIGNMGGHFNIELATAPYDILVNNLADKIIDKIKA